MSVFTKNLCFADIQFRTRIFVQSLSLNILYIYTNVYKYIILYIINFTIFYVDSTAVELVRVGTMVLIKKTN